MPEALTISLIVIGTALLLVIFIVFCFVGRKPSHGSVGGGGDAGVIGDGGGDGGGGGGCGGD